MAAEEVEAAGDSGDLGVGLRAGWMEELVEGTRGKLEGAISHIYQKRKVAGEWSWGEMT